MMKWMEKYIKKTLMHANLKASSTHDTSHNQKTVGRQAHAFHKRMHHTFQSWLLINCFVENFTVSSTKTANENNRRNQGVAHFFSRLRDISPIQAHVKSKKFEGKKLRNLRNIWVQTFLAVHLVLKWATPWPKCARESCYINFTRNWFFQMIIRRINEFK